MFFWWCRGVLVVFFFFFNFYFIIIISFPPPLIEQDRLVQFLGDLIKFFLWVFTLGICAIHCFLTQFLFLSKIIPEVHVPDGWNFYQNRDKNYLFFFVAGFCTSRLCHTVSDLQQPLCYFQSVKSYLISSCSYVVVCGNITLESVTTFLQDFLLQDTGKVCTEILFLGE